MPADDLFTYSKSRPAFPNAETAIEALGGSL